MNKQIRICIFFMLMIMSSNMLFFTFVSEVNATVSEPRGNKVVTTSYSIVDLTSQTYKASYRFTANETKTVDKIRIHLSVFGTPPTHRIGLQSDNNGNPSGTFLNYSDISVFNNYWNVIDIPNTTITASLVYHIVIEPLASPDGNFLRVVGTKPHNKRIPYDYSFDNNLNFLEYKGSWTLKNADPHFILDFTDGTYYGFPYNIGGEQEAFYGSRRIGQLFNLSTSLSFHFIGFYIKKDGSPPDGVHLVIENVTNNQVVINQTIFSASEVSTAPSWHGYKFSSLQTLVGGKQYRLYLESPNSDLNNGYWSFDSKSDTSVTPYNELSWDGTNSVFIKDTGTGWVKYLNIDLPFCLEEKLEASNLTVDDYRVNPSQILTMSGYLYYENTEIPPPDGNYQVKIMLGGVQKGSTDTSLVSGYFSISDVTAEAEVGSYSYTVEASYMTGPATFSAVIVDKLDVTFSASTTSPNIGEPVTIYWTIKRLYDNSTVTDFTIDIERNDVLWKANLTVNNTTDTQNSRFTATYDVASSTVTDNTYDLTAYQSIPVTVTWSEQGGGGGGGLITPTEPTKPVKPPAVAVPPLAMYGSIILIGIVAFAVAVSQAKRSGSVKQLFEQRIKRKPVRWPKTRKRKSLREKWRRRYG